MRNISLKLFEFGPVVQEMLKIFLIYSSVNHFVWRSETFCAVFGRGHYEKHFFDIILNLDQQFGIYC